MWVCVCVLVNLREINDVRIPRFNNLLLFFFYYYYEISDVSLMNFMPSGEQLGREGVSNELLGARMRNKVGCERTLVTLLNCVLLYFAVNMGTLISR